MGKRTLPSRRNPHLVDGKDVNYEQLLETRRLGQTSMASARRNQGSSEMLLNYAHLKVALPAELLEGKCELFPLNLDKGPPPESYFLMRRSGDGFVSATGMFKATFPFATKAEEEAERDYLKNDSTTSGDEIAGNIWIAPDRALALAKEYKMETWIKVLLDNSPIPTSAADRKKKIEPPPPFHPTSEPNTKQGRAPRHRTASPDPTSVTANAAASARKILSPTKGRPRKAAESAKTTLTDGVSAASNSLKNAVTSAGQRVSSLGDTIRHSTHVGTDVKIRIKQDVESRGEGRGETTHTHVDVLLPKGSDALDLPEDVEKIMEKAKAAIEAGKADIAKSGGGSGGGGGDGGSKAAETRGKKRKAGEVEEDGEHEEGGEEHEEERESGEAGDSADERQVGRPKAKRTRVAEVELKVERVKNRALLGLTGALAIGTILPYIL